MTIVLASRLSRADVRMLGTNVESAIRQGSSRSASVKRSLPIDEDGVEEPSIAAGTVPWADQEAVA